jgi:hypothetical protein
MVAAAQPLPVGSGRVPLRGCAAWRQRVNDSRGSLVTPSPQGPRAPVQAANIAGDCVGVSQGGGSRPIGSRESFLLRKRSAASGSAVWSASGCRRLGRMMGRRRPRPGPCGKPFFSGSEQMLLCPFARESGSSFSLCRKKGSRGPWVRCGSCAHIHR